MLFLYNYVGSTTKFVVKEVIEDANMRFDYKISKNLKLMPQMILIKAHNRIVY